MRNRILLFICFILMFETTNMLAHYTKVLCIDPGHGGPARLSV